MKQDTPDHPKLKSLCRTLDLKRWEAVGLLESLWHFTAKFTPRGNIGKWSNEEIACEIDWDRTNPHALIGALIECGFLDESVPHRLVIHDWHDHATQGINRRADVRRLGFASRELDATSEQLDTSNNETGTQNKNQLHPQRSGLGLGSGNGLGDGLGCLNGFAGEILNEYPKGHKGQGLGALQAIAAAIKRLLDAPGEPDGIDAVVDWLKAKTAEYAKARKGATHTLGAKRWFDEEGYLQDPDEWAPCHDGDQPETPEQRRQHAKEQTRRMFEKMEQENGQQ